MSRDGSWVLHVPVPHRCCLCVVDGALLTFFQDQAERFPGQHIVPDGKIALPSDGAPELIRRARSDGYEGLRIPRRSYQSLEVSFFVG